MDRTPSPASPAPAPLAPMYSPSSVLDAPDLASAEQAYLGLLPDHAHVDAFARRTLIDARQQTDIRYALSLTLVGLRLQELKMGEACASTGRRDSLDSLRQAFAAG